MQQQEREMLIKYFSDEEHRFADLIFKSGKKLLRLSL